MALWQFDLEFVARRKASGSRNAVELSIDADALQKAEDLIRRQLASATSWSPDLRVWGEEDGNRIDIYMNGKRCVGIALRVDLRTNPTAFCELVIAFAQMLDCSFVTTDGSLVPADMPSLRAAALRSNAWKFVWDPRGYLDSAPPID